MWITFFAVIWMIIFFIVTIFIVVDARNAYDGDVTTTTLSGYIKVWRRKKPARAYGLGAGIVGLALIPAYLFLHLVLELV